MYVLCKHGASRFCPGAAPAPSTPPRPCCSAGGCLRRRQLCPYSVAGTPPPTSSVPGPGSADNLLSPLSPRAIKKRVNVDLLARHFHIRAYEQNVLPQPGNCKRRTPGRQRACNPISLHRCLPIPPQKSLPCANMYTEITVCLL